MAFRAQVLFLELIWCPESGQSGQDSFGHTVRNRRWFMNDVRFSRIAEIAGVILLAAVLAPAQQALPRPREFPAGTVKRIEDLPVSRLRTRIEGLPAGPRLRALDWLGKFHFTELDLNSLQADSEGGIYYADIFSLDPAAAPKSAGGSITRPAVPVSPFPTSLIFHSKRGSSNVLYLNFSGETVTNTLWNSSLGRPTIRAVGFSTDTNFASFSDAEQSAIKRIWQRVAEDYAPFDIDVTTERPGALGTRTAHALITRSLDADGKPNPSPSGGGVRYINV